MTLAGGFVIFFLFFGLASESPNFPLKARLLPKAEALKIRADEPGFLVRVVGLPSL
jgi:hypothetical protein